MLSLRTATFLAATIAAAPIVYGGFEPDQYLIHVRGITTPQPYPFAAVGFFVLLACGESLALYSLLRWPRALHQIYRLLIATLLFGTWTFLLLAMSMHQPGYYFGHVLWAIVVFLFLFVALIGSLFKRLFSA